MIYMSAFVCVCMWMCLLLSFTVTCSSRHLRYIIPAVKHFHTHLRTRTVHTCTVHRRAHTHTHTCLPAPSNSSEVILKLWWWRKKKEKKKTWHAISAQWRPSRPSLLQQVNNQLVIKSAVCSAFITGYFRRDNIPNSVQAQPEECITHLYISSIHVLHLIPNSSFSYTYDGDIMAVLSCLAVYVYVTSHAAVNTAYSYVEWQARRIVWLCDVYSTFPI